MRVLVDTHALLWFASADRRLPAPIRSMLDAPEAHELFVSVVSCWELAIKSGSGKLKLDPTLLGFLRRTFRQNGFRPLPVRLRHVLRLETLPLHHRDPFDRMLIAQASAENIPPVSGDVAFDAYGVSRLW